MMDESKTTWQPIDTAPKGRKVLVYYKNACGKGRTVLARYVAKHTEEDTSESDMDMDYSEEKDCYYWPEGWYEEIDNWDDYSSVKISQALTHWMPLPEAPQ